MYKCEVCKYSDIDHVLFYDMCIDKCHTCESYRIFYKDYEQLIKNYMITENFANLKKYNNILEANDDELKLVNSFIRSMGLKNFKINGLLNVNCNFCRDDLILMTNIDYSDFKIYYCSYCNSLYFDKESFLKAASHFKEFIPKKMKWYGFIYKIIEIFQ